MPDETQNPFDQAAAPAAESAPVAEAPAETAPAQAPAEQPAVEPASEPVAPEQPPVDNAHVEQDAEQFVNDAATEAEEVIHTHESVLTALMGQLEGMVHMAKAEVEAVVSHARSLFEKL